MTRPALWVIVTILALPTGQAESVVLIDDEEDCVSVDSVVGMEDVSPKSQLSPNYIGCQEDDENIPEDKEKELLVVSWLEDVALVVYTVEELDDVIVLDNTPLETDVRLISDDEELTVDED